MITDGFALMGPTMTRAVFDTLPDQDVTCGDFDSPSTRLLHRSALLRGWKTRTLDARLKMSAILLPDPDGGDSVWSIVLRNTRCELGSALGNAIAEDKTAMVAIAAQYGLSVPSTHEFTTREDAHAWLAAGHSPLVVGPAQRHSGNLSLGVATPEELDKALDLAGAPTSSDSVNSTRRPKRILLQQEIAGDEFRVVVVGGRMVAAAKRVKAFVVGDGSSTIAQLIAEKNTDPRRAKGHPSAMSPISLEVAAEYLRATAAAAAKGDGAAAAEAEAEGGDEEEEEKKKDPLQAVPSAGQHVVLCGVARLTHGGEVHDVTDLVHPAVLEIAETWARVAGMGVVGVDIRAASGVPISEPPAVTNPCVIALNSAPTLQLHHYPTVGDKRDVAGAIIDEIIRRRRLMLGRPAHPRWTVCVQRQRSAPSLCRFRDILLERRGADGIPQWCVSRNPRAAPNLLLCWRDHFSFDWLNDRSPEARAARRAAAAQADAGAYLAAKRGVPRLTNFAPWYRRLTKLQLMRVLEALADRRTVESSDPRAGEEVLAIAPLSFWLRSNTPNKGRTKFTNAVRARQEQDGTQGIWIVKPAAGNKGSGIVIKTNLDAVLEYVDSAAQRAADDAAQAAALKKERRVLLEGQKFEGQDVDHLDRMLDTDGVPVVHEPEAKSLEQEEEEAEEQRRLATSGNAPDSPAKAPIHDFVVQSYLENPLLVEGYKFDIRVYAIVDPWLRLHIFTQNMLKLSATPFTLDPATFDDRYVHLTNHCIAKESANYGAVTPTNEMGFPMFDDWLHKNMPGRSIEGDVMPALVQMLRVVGDALEPFMRTRPANSSAYCFQRLGLDVMLDENFRAVLLEVNTNPGGSPDLANKLLRSEIELVVDPLFPPFRTKSGSVWEGAQTAEKQHNLAAEAASAAAAPVHPVPPPTKEPKLFRLVHDYGPQVAAREAREAAAAAAAAAQ